MEQPPLSMVGADYGVEIWSSHPNPSITYRPLPYDSLKVEVEVEDNGWAHIIIDVAEGTVTGLIVSFKTSIALTLLRVFDSRVLFNLPLIEIATEPGSSTMLLHADQRVQRKKASRLHLRWIHFFSDP